MTSLKDLLAKNPEAQFIQIKSSAAQLRISLRRYIKAVENSHRVVHNPKADKNERQKSFAALVKAGYTFEDSMWVFRKDVMNFYDY